MNDLHRNKTLLWSLLAVFIIVMLWALDARTLVPPDEGRYAEMAREMFASGDWITTRLNGIKYFEKPPLQTWMNALTFTVFGLGDWQARLWTGLNGILGVVLVWYTGRKLFGERIGFYAGLVLGSCFYWAACSQIDSLDMGVSGMMTIALCALLLAQRNDATPAERRNWMLVCWLGMALAMLAKGLIGIMLPGAVLVLYTLFSRDWNIWTRLHLGKGLLLFFVVAAPWHVLVGLRNPEQPHFYFIHEHFERFFLKEHHREAAWYTFFVLLAAGSVPWVGVLVQSLVQGARRDTGTDLARGPFRPRLMLLIWLVFIVLFFTKSNSKLPGYILPVFPAAALLIANYLDVGSRRSRMATSAITALLGVVLLAIVPFMTRFAKHAGEDVLFAAYQPWVLAAGFVATLGGVLALIYARQMKRDLMVLALAVASFASTELLMAGFEPIAKARAGVNLMPQITAELKQPATIYSVGIYEQSLTFYLRRPVVLVDYWDEFTFGLQQQPELSIPTIPQWVAKWRADAAAGHHDLAIIRDDIVAELKKQGVPLRVVAADSRRMVIANY